MPDPILVGRNAEKVAALAQAIRHRALHHRSRRRAEEPGRHRVLRCRARRRCAPTCVTPGDRGRQAHLLREAGRRHARQGDRARRSSPSSSGIKNGVVQDKLFLPGLRKIAHAARCGLLRPHARGARRVRLLGVRGRLGPAGAAPELELPKAEGGGIILDMLCHWRYVLDNLFGEVQGGELPRRHPHPAAASTRTARPTRPTPTTRPTRPSSSRAASIAHINSSWAMRVRRDDLVTFQVDGTHGSAVAGPDRCWTQHRVNTPRPVWNPDVPQTMKFVDAVGRGAGQHHLRQRLQDPVGGFHPPRRRRYAVEARSASRAPRACSLPSSACRAGPSGAGSMCRRSSI